MVHPPNIFYDTLLKNKCLRTYVHAHFSHDVKAFKYNNFDNAFIH